MIFFTNLHTNSFILPPFMTNYQTGRECFKVSKLNDKSKKWVEVEDLGDFVIFSGTWL